MKLQLARTITACTRRVFVSQSQGKEVVGALLWRAGGREDSLETPFSDTAIKGKVPMLPLLALAPVAWNLRHLQQKGEMSCKIRVF